MEKTTAFNGLPCLVCFLQAHPKLDEIEREKVCNVFGEVEPVQKRVEGYDLFGRWQRGFDQAQKEKVLYVLDEVRIELNYEHILCEVHHGFLFFLQNMQFVLCMYKIHIVFTVCFLGIMDYANIHDIGCSDSCDLLIIVCELIV